MLPTIRPGSIVVVERGVEPLEQLDGQIVCARDAEGRLIVKRLWKGFDCGYFHLCSDNPRQPPICIRGPEARRLIIGCVHGIWRPLTEGGEV